MASIFTFDPDPPRVSSPWTTPPPGPRLARSIPQDSAPNRFRTSADGASDESSADYSSVTRLEAEPQEGPTEYKLHLLLRRRRSFTHSSTGRRLAGSLRRVETPILSSENRSVSESGLLSNIPPPAAAIQSRQHRLQQLTTQLLWRLQQSCPHHISSSTALVLPLLPDKANFSTPAVPQRLLPGLEESKGALYEIGVADDGTFIGLAEDEMEESLNNLRAMASSLSCRVDVLKMVQVGDCEWLEDPALSGARQRKTITGKLWVAEALVRPDQHLIDSRSAQAVEQDLHDASNNLSLVGSANEVQNSTQQLRISLTGATMSGKSSLLGSLSTATLDNGRGKSRLSLLKHRHEIASGMTSSVTQELLGYHDLTNQEGTRTSTQVISYGSGNVSSWVDIHASAEGGRLVFLSDSAGHPRFRRTTVRGLVGWDPHWTLLCIPADNTEDTVGRIGASPTPQEILGPAAADVDLSQAHLQLCLNLELPLVVIVTKYDLATKAGLTKTLRNILSAIKNTGRKPVIQPKAAALTSEDELNAVTTDVLAEAGRAVKELKTAPLSIVPIILTSALDGTGINQLHAFLRELPPPLPSKPDHPDGASSTLFHVEDVYSNILAPSRTPDYAQTSSSSPDRSVIIGGHLRYGTLSVGDELVLGPYPADSASEDSDGGSGRGSTPPNRSTRTTPLPTSRSFPGALHKDGQGHAALQYAKGKQSEWRCVRVTSVRNLRLPVRSLHAGQVGTIGVAPVNLPIATPAVVRIRKGMVLTDGERKANRVITVRFCGGEAEAVKSLSVGSAVVVYIASVRASAKVVSVAPEPQSQQGAADECVVPEDEEDGFGFGFEDEDTDDTADEAGAPSSTVVTFQFIASREFVEIDAKVLVLPGGGPGLYGGTERGEKGIAGLEGFVGRVIDGPS